VSLSTVGTSIRNNDNRVGEVCRHILHHRTKMMRIENKINILFSSGLGENTNCTGELDGAFIIYLLFFLFHLYSRNQRDRETC